MEFKTKSFVSLIDNIKKKQFCRLNEKDSQMQTIECIACRVPQGTCLVPLLFLVYMNDLPNAIMN